jgi:hypothetical protein
VYRGDKITVSNTLDRREGEGRGREGRRKGGGEGGRGGKEGGGSIPLQTFLKLSM